jgi:hypothetical protein
VFGVYSFDETPDDNMDMYALEIKIKRALTRLEIGEGE